MTIIKQKKMGFT